MKTPQDISTTYLGLPLRSPFIPSACPLSEHLDGLIEMERCGAGAVVLHSLFEEPCQAEPHHVERYLDEVMIAKRHLTIPVIASLNAGTPAAGCNSPGRSRNRAPTRWNSTSTA